MTNLHNIQRAVSLATRFVQATWQQAVMGTVPGLPEVRAEQNVLKLYSDSIIRGEQLNLPNTGYFRGQVLATKQIAVDLEYGKGPWDMKPMLLHGPKARVGKNGKRYNIIPFRHALPTSKAAVAGQPMSKDIYKAAKALKPSLQGTIKTKWGGRLTGTEVKHPASSNPTTGYKHKTGIYEGMVKVQKAYTKATQSKYLTFRRVSEDSDPNSWWHPGYHASHISQAVSTYCKPGVEDMIRQAAIDDLVAIPNLSIGIRMAER